MGRTEGRSSLNWYLDQIRHTPLLTPRQEKQLARRIQREGDFQARERMIQSNLRLVIRIANDYPDQPLGLEDRVAEGNLGLLRAVETFDPEAGTRFGTYASWWIRQSISRAIREAHSVHLPAYLSKLIGRWKRMETKMTERLGRKAEPEEIAKALRISRSRSELVRLGLAATSSTVPIQEDSDSRTGDRDAFWDLNAEGIRTLLDRLPERMQKILVLRFALDDPEGKPRTFRQIAEKVGLSRERVRQLVGESLRELRDSLQHSRGREKSASTRAA